MGQGQDRTEDRRQDNRGRASRKALFGRLGVALDGASRSFRFGLVGSVVCIGVLAAAQGGAPAPQPTQKLAFDQARAWTDLTKQVAFGPRTPGTDAHKKCRDYIFEELKKTCENVRLQEFDHTWSRTNKSIKMWNVIGEQNWKDAKVHVLLTAHWDTRPYADQEWDTDRAAKPVIGANDGASGVAVLLELARVLKENKPGDVGIMYFLNDGEDLGPGLDEMFLGAKYFAKNLPTPKPDYGILLDMIGDKNLVVPMEPNSLAFAGNLLTDLYRHASSIGLGRTFPMTRGPEISDDHLSLNEAGIPTIDLIDFDYPAWHKDNDTPDKCSAESLGKVGKLLQTWLEKKPAYQYKK